VSKKIRLAVGLSVFLAGVPVAARESLDTQRGAVAASRAKTAASKTKETNGAPMVTFSGFQVFHDGKSRLYVDLSSSVEVTEKVEGKKAVYKLEGARIEARNNENPLVTSHFSAMVVHARLTDEAGRGKHRHRHKKTAGPASVVIVVQMREAAQPTHRMQKNPDGSARLIIDFPKPKKTPAPEPDEVAPKPKAPSTDAPK
jgi:hypothetical protein